MKKVRFRRMDAHNFVTEKRVAESDKGRKDGSTEWRAVGHYPTVQAMLADAVNTQAYGDSGAELAKAVQRSTSTLLAAFLEAVQTGALVLDQDAKDERYRKAAATRKERAVG